MLLLKTEMGRTPVSPSRLQCGVPWGLNWGKAHSSPAFWQGDRQTASISEETLWASGLASGLGLVSRRGSSAEQTSQVQLPGLTAQFPNVLRLP